MASPCGWGTSTPLAAQPVAAVRPRAASGVGGTHEERAAGHLAHTHTRTCTASRSLVPIVTFKTKSVSFVSAVIDTCRPKKGLVTAEGEVEGAGG